MSWKSPARGGGTLGANGAKAEGHGPGCAFSASDRTEWGMGRGVTGTSLCSQVPVRMGKDAQCPPGRKEQINL